MCGCVHVCVLVGVFMCVCRWVPGCVNVFECVGWHIHLNIHYFVWVCKSLLEGESEREKVRYSFDLNQGHSGPYRKNRKDILFGFGSFSQRT